MNQPETCYKDREGVGDKPIPYAGMEVAQEECEESTRIGGLETQFHLERLTHHVKASQSATCVGDKTCVLVEVSIAGGSEMMTVSGELATRMPASENMVPMAFGLADEDVYGLCWV